MRNRSPPEEDFRGKAGEEFGYRTSAIIEARREGAEARPFHSRDEGGGAREGDLMPRRHRRLRDGHERMEVAGGGESGEQETHGEILPVHLAKTYPTRVCTYGGKREGIHP